MVFINVLIIVIVMKVLEFILFILLRIQRIIWNEYIKYIFKLKVNIYIYNQN